MNPLTNLRRAIFVLFFASGSLCYAQLDCQKALEGPEADRFSDRHFSAGLGLFFEGDYLHSGKHFEDAISTASKDARYWYFKALVELRTGDQESAFKSASTANELAARGFPSVRKVGLALERIQGSDRLWLINPTQFVEKTIVSVEKTEVSQTVLVSVHKQHRQLSLQDIDDEVPYEQRFRDALVSKIVAKEEQFRTLFNSASNSPEIDVWATESVNAMQMRQDGVYWRFDDDKLEMDDAVSLILNVMNEAAQESSFDPTGMMPRDRWDSPNIQLAEVETCPDGSAKKDPGTPCDDGNPNTKNDKIQEDGCTCAGELRGGVPSFTGPIVSNDNCVTVIGAPNLEAPRCAEPVCIGCYGICDVNCYCGCLCKFRRLILRMRGILR